MLFDMFQSRFDLTSMSFYYYEYSDEALENQVRQRKFDSWIYADNVTVVPGKKGLKDKVIFSNVKRMISVHSEDEYRLRERKSMISKSSATVLDHPNWRDVVSAVQSTKRLLKIANLTNKKIHILHLSTADEIDLLEKNKHIATCEVTPQHLFFSSPDCYESLGTFVQMNPPIRDKAHTSGLWKGIVRGIVDVIGSDHAPHTIEEKKKDYPNSPSGMTGVQTLLPIMLNFVNKNKLSIFDLVKLVCINPCKIFNINRYE